MKNLIIISFTRQGSRLNRKMNHLFTEQGYACESYTVERFAEQEGLLPLKKNLKEWIGTVWGEKDFLFIGATGIAVRMIAPWVKDKFTDSAVLVLDEKAEFVIPLLSGHMGGGVELAHVIASCTGAVPVITTATDVQGYFAVDVFAKRNRLCIGNRVLAKQISAAVLEGKKIGFYSEYPVKENLPEELELCNCTEDLDKYEWGIAVSAKRAESEKILSLIPQNLVVGIGCRKGVVMEQIQEQLEDIFREKSWDIARISMLASVDLKKEEPGLVELARKYGVPFQTYPAEDLKRIETVSDSSAFVESVTGVDNVCERAAIQCCPEGTLLLPKRKLNQVTVAVVERKVEIDF